MPWSLGVFQFVLVGIFERYEGVSCSGYRYISSETAEIWTIEQQRYSNTTSWNQWIKVDTWLRILTGCLIKFGSSVDCIGIPDE